MFHSLISLFSRLIPPSAKPVQHLPRWVRDPESAASVSQLAFGKTAHRVALPPYNGSLPRMLQVSTNRPVRLRFGDANVEATGADGTLHFTQIYDVPPVATHVSALEAIDLGGGSIVVWQMHAEGVSN